MRQPNAVPEYSDLVLVVGVVSRPKLAVVFLSLMIISLFLTFHVLYDRAIYSIELHQIPSPADVSGHQHPFKMRPRISSNSSLVISHPIVRSNNKFHFAKTGRRLPQALIVGNRKCGTRALLEMLYLHPRVQKAAGEVHFFDRDDNYAKGLEWYRKKMPYSFRGQITIEKSPSYFVTPEVNSKNKYSIS